MAQLPMVGWVEMGAARAGGPVARAGERLHARPDCPRIKDPSRLCLVERPVRVAPCLLCLDAQANPGRRMPRQRRPVADS